MKSHVKGSFPNEINIALRACIAGKTSITEISNTSTMRWKGTALLVTPHPLKSLMSEDPYTSTVLGEISKMQIHPYRERQ